jgi:hypothetical protein
MRRSTKGRQQLSIADGRYLCWATGFGTRQRTYFIKCLKPDTRQIVLCRVYHGHLVTYFYFFYFPNQTFCGLFLHYVDLHVLFWHNYKSVCYCDTPGVYFTLYREIYPNLGCSVKISISRSHLSPFIKLLMNVSPSLELFDLKNNQIWSLLKLLFLKANTNSKVNLISQLPSRLIYSDSR